jgi:hypothetical protein
VICTSTDFAAGFSAAVYRSATPLVAENATEITAISTANTANPQLYITFPNGDPVSGDTIKLDYDATSGDIAAVTGGNALASFSTELEGTVCT